MFPVPQHPRETERDAGGCRYGFLLRGWVRRSEAFSGFCVQLYTPEIHNRKVKPVPTCSEEQGLRGKDSAFLAGGKVLAACTTRTSTPSKQMVWLAHGKVGEDLALLQHFSSVSPERLSQAAGWRDSQGIADGWRYGSAPTPICHELLYWADLTATRIMPALTNVPATQ